MATRTFRVGGFASDTPSDFIYLEAQLQTSGRVSTFRRSGSGSGYQITAGKTIYLVRATFSSYQVPASAILDAIAIGYADNDVGWDATTARTNPVAVVGTPEQTTQFTIGGFLSDPRLNGNNPIYYAWENIFIPVTGGASKYLYMKGFYNGGGIIQMQLWGYEA